VSAGLKWLAVGLLIGVAATLLVEHITADDEGIPEQLAEALGCSDGVDGVHPSTAARAHRYFGRSDGFSWFAVTHAERILGVNGCDSVGPASSFLEFGEETDMRHVLATLDHFGAVCIVDLSVFEGKVLNGRAHLEELCQTVGGQLKVLHSAG
jgi:hypothetical protein